jgi:predicted nucleic acid-binding Zn ribbon protein
MVAMERGKCVICGTSLPADAGNRRRYCGQTCKRTAEFEIRRTNALIYRAQKQAQDLAAPTPVTQWVSPDSLKDRQKRLSYWLGEVERLRESLRQLVDEDARGAYADPDRSR